MDFGGGAQCVMRSKRRRHHQMVVSKFPDYAAQQAANALQVDRAAMLLTADGEALGSPRARLVAAQERDAELQQRMKAKLEAEMEAKM